MNQSMTSKTFRTLFVLVLAVVMAITACTPGQPEPAKELDFPTKDIELVLPVPAGGSSDTLARYIAESLSKETGVNVYITNQPGGALTLGTNDVMKSAPDGYKLLATPLGPIVMQFHYRELAYKYEDIKPIAYTGARYDVLASKSGKFESYEALVDYLKSGASATYGNVAVGGLPHIATENFLLQIGGSAESVGFDGDADALTAMLGGHVDFAIIGGNYLEYYKSGDLDIFAVGSPERLESMPDVPTFKELGYDIDTAIWEGIYAPAGISDELAQYLNTAINKALKDPVAAEKIQAMGNVQNPMTLEEFQKFCDDQYAMYGHIINETDAGKRIKDLMGQ